MLNTKVKVGAIALVIVVQCAYLYWLRARSPKLPVSIQNVKSLAELTEKERQEYLASLFALSNFRIEPLEAKENFVTIPRPTSWLEQMVHTANYLVVDTVEHSPPKSTDAKPENPPASPPTPGFVKVDIASIDVSLCESVPMSRVSSAFMTEKVINRDAYMNKSGIVLPVLELVSLNVYYFDEIENVLQETQKAVRMNGGGKTVLLSDIPKWLMPNRKLAVGEAWVQVGAHPNGIPTSAPRPEVTRKINKLVQFEGRPAAEITTASSICFFAYGPDAPPVKLQEEGLVYLDLDTGEPLWYEIKSKGNHEFTSLTRGCNQIFSKHLIRTPQK